jgi:hypothetical protein
MIFTATGGASIFYTTDGSVPLPTQGTAYTEPIALSTSLTLNAVAVKDGLADSAVTSGTYALSTATPAPGLAEGSYSGAQSLSLSSGTANATILYTLDGSTPTTSNALLYNGSPILLQAPTLFSATIPVKVLALRPGFADSPVLSATYTINRKPFTGFESAEGYTAGASLVSGTQPSASGATKWTSDSAPAKIFVVDASGGNPGQAITSGNFTSGDFVGSKSARISPTLADLGASAPLGRIILRYDLRLNFTPGSSTSAAHNIVGPRDTSGTNQGRVTQIAIRNDGSLAYNSGASSSLLAKKADGSSLALAQNQWVSIIYTLDYPTRTWTLEIDGVKQKDADGSTALTFQTTSITGAGADEFGSISLSVPGSFADWGSISLDNLDFFVPAYRSPTGLTALAVSNSQIDLDWTDPAPDETGFLLETSSGSSWSTVANLPANITSYSHVGLEAGSARSYRLSATYATGTSATVSISTTTLNPPAAPVGLTGTVTDTTASLFWPAVSGANSYLVKYSATQGGPYTSVVSDLDITSYQDTDLSPGTHAYYVVSATGPGGEGANSAELALTTHTSLQQWRQDNFSTVANSGPAADSADPDGDGVPNLLAYAFGLTSSSPQASKQPVIDTAFVSDQPRLTLSFTRIADPALTYMVWASSDLVDWGVSPVWSSSGPENVDGPFTFTDEIDLFASPRRFLRLQVTTP